ncbi:hydrogenase 3 maturation protease [Candidatus Methanophagaceae archaeon]|nr:hydrogenase 3 maturation protease [Methanophagales archaeon]
MKELEERIRDLLKGRIVYMGMGNILRGDDGIGPKLVEVLRKKGAGVVDAGTVPESYIGPVKRLEPDTIVMIDAVHLDREPGSVELLERDEILENSGFSTHSLSPVLVMERLESETGAAVFMLAIQPGTLKLGDPLSPAVNLLLTTLPDLLPGT